MSKPREPFRTTDRHFISFDSALLFGQPQNDSIERTRRPSVPGGVERDCPAQCCDEYDMLFRHLTHAACRMPVGLSAQFNRLSSPTKLSLCSKLLPTFWGSPTPFDPSRFGSIDSTPRQNEAYEQNCCLLFRAGLGLTLHAHTIKIARKKLNQSANRIDGLCARVCALAYGTCCHAAGNPLM